MAEMMRTDSVMTSKDKREHVQIRIGYHRMDHKVDPGLYLIGVPSAASPVFVTSNYKLSFDALRTSLNGFDAYVLVLDTKGINVWCAAGKGTFGTDELVGRIESSGLKDVVSHREVILPQLGAPGVAAHEVKRRTGFQVIYGPVRALDIKEFMDAGKKASKEMRRVRFPLKDRLVLAPVEMKNFVLYALLFSIIGFLIAGAFGLAVVFGIYFAGLLLFPLLLPYLPSKDFTMKGMFLGGLISIPLVAATLCLWKDMDPIEVASFDASIVLMCVSVVGYLGLNWTGCTPYPSRTGVRREIYRYIPIIAAMAVAATVLALVAGLFDMGAWF
ncbi:MAG: carbon monoxide dehydrogenase [Euryarchaeota archaeon]|nr:carbon monoxide dehydrogenase [Euryarchaeota archaeon]